MTLAIPKKAKKKRAPSVKTLLAKLEDLFSRYVRLSAADASGYLRCVACQRAFHWKDVDAGHFVGKRASAVRFDERNVHPECRGCNRFSQDHLVGYTIWMQEQYGDMVVAELWAKKHETKKWNRAELESMIDLYATKLARIALNPGEREPSEIQEWQRNHVS